MAFENLKSTGIAYVLTKLKDHFLQIKDAVRTVNNEEPDENGNIQIDSVPYAQNLESETAHRNSDSFIQRTTGGTSSIENGDAWLMNIKGNYIHEGFVPESIDMQLTTVERDNPITATIDRDTFVGYVAESGTIVLTYANGWSDDPASYGITVTGTAVNGDVITVVYVKEERGTITQSNPQTLVSTGWNLYSHANTYAKVVKYEFGYRISGSYTSLKYSSTVDGAQSSIVVSENNFDIPADGYVWVTGGNGTDTAIYPTWEDWTDGHTGSWEAYSASTVYLSTVMSNYFPYGLMAVGSVQDEIDLNLGNAYSRVERLDYNATNLATAENSGREYEYDEDYIYLAKASADVEDIVIDGSMTVDDHGIQFFEGTDVNVDAEILFGSNLKNKLERDVLTISQQDLTSAQKTQVQKNLGLEIANNLTTTASGKVLDARQGKTLYDRLAYKSFTSSITYGSKIERASGYTENGCVYVFVELKASQTAGFSEISFTLPSAYVPRAVVYGSYRITSASDHGKISEVQLNTNNTIQIYVSSANTAAIYATFVYPLKS